MKTRTFPNGTITQTNHALEDITISHSLVKYLSHSAQKAHNPANTVRLHFGLRGDYDFNYEQLNASYELRGEHNNIMYSNGLDIEVFNHSDEIETFGVNFAIDSFIKIAENGNEPLKRFAEKVIDGKSAILSEHWRPNNFRIRQVIQEIIDCPYSEELKDLFLLSKSIELLVLQADLYAQSQEVSFIKKKFDKERLMEAKRILRENLETPPTIRQLSLQIGMNEYKLKKGFKELFGTTVFGFIHQNRMSLAKKLLLGTDKSAKEIAYEAGYSSPQHFSRAFKKEFKISPDRMRKNPDRAI